VSASVRRSGGIEAALQAASLGWLVLCAGACSNAQTTIPRVSCPVGQLACGQQCVDVASDPKSCGACGLPCGADQTCVAGVCTCAAGTFACNGSCVTAASAPAACPAEAQPTLVTSAPGAYWNTDGQLTAVTDGKADVTVDDSATAQTWEGFGGAFNELGWSYLSLLGEEDRARALQLLFGADGARFTFGRIPIGASDYAVDRYTDDEVPSGSTDYDLTAFSISRDLQALIPYVKAAQAVKPTIRLWASPWTPPTWMKEGPFSSGNLSTPFDGGAMKGDAATLDAYARYLIAFVSAYAQQGLTIEAVSAQNEPNYTGTYPTCSWSPQTYTAFIGQHLGPALAASGLTTKLMLGTLNGSGSDPGILSSVMGDDVARGYVGALGFQWGMKSRVGSSKAYDLPIWQTEHMCGNYPWVTPFNASAAPNDDAYAVESWGLIRDWINAGATAYSAWNMVLDTTGVGIDSTRIWPQDALLVVDTTNKALIVTPAFQVFRHVSRFVAPGAKVLKASGGDAVAFKNPDGTVAAVVHNGGAARILTVALAGKMWRFAMPAAGWATVLGR